MRMKGVSVAHCPFFNRPGSRILVLGVGARPVATLTEEAVVLTLEQNNNMNLKAYPFKGMNVLIKDFPPAIKTGSELAEKMRRKCPDLFPGGLSHLVNKSFLGGKDVIQ